MRAFIFFIVFAITQLLPNSEGYTGDHCREDVDRYQNKIFGDAFIKKAILDGTEIILRAENLDANKNSNVNVNTGISRVEPTNVGIGYTEWWEVVTRRIPLSARRSNTRVHQIISNSYDTIKPQIASNRNNEDFDEPEKREQPISSSINLKASDRDGTINTHTRKHLLAPQASSRRLKESFMQEKSTRLSKHTVPSIAQDKKSDDNSETPTIESTRKLNKNQNINTNVNQYSRRNSNSNLNQNINVNDNSQDVLNEDLHGVYPKLARNGFENPDEIVSAKSVAPVLRPSGDRGNSNANINQNVNSNVYSDLPYSKAPIRDEEFRRNLHGKKRPHSRPHHPNDNHNVNININGEEPIDQGDSQGYEALEGEQLNEGEPNNAIL